MSGRRVCEFGAWPQKIMARILSGWSMFSLASSTASNQRDTVMPFDSISFLEAKRPCSQS